MTAERWIAAAEIGSVTATIHRRWSPLIRWVSRAEVSTAISLVLGLIAGGIVAKLIAGSPTLPLITLAVVATVAYVGLEIVRRRSETPPKHAAPDIRDPVVRRQRIRQAIAIGVPIILVVGICFWFVKERSDSPAANYRISVEANPDHLTTRPQLRAALGNYVTTLPISKVPAPPGDRDSCDGRYSWAHSTPIDGVDAERTLLLVNITTVHRTAFLNGADIAYENPQTAALTSTLLACPGGGGPTPPDLLRLDLDTDSTVFYPHGGDTPGDLNVRIAVGQTTTLIVSADAIKSYARWRLVLGLYDGHRQIAVVIGPDGALFGQPGQHPHQRPFQTTGDLAAQPFRFRNGAWQPGR